jgi:hypothetical protein
MDRDSDDARLGDPGRWFGAEDAAALIHHNDARTLAMPGGRRSAR